MQKEAGKTDRRILRTKQTLRNAMIELIIEKHYDSITVQNIIDRANVGRSTFYSHFRDKEDLFREDWQRFLRHFVSRFNWKNLDNPVPIRYIFEHLKEFHPFYRGLVRSGKIESVFRYGQNYLAKLIEQDLDKNEIGITNPIVPNPLLANFLSDGIFSILKWWLDQNMPYSARRMDRMFRTLVIPGVISSLETSEINRAEF